MPTTVPHVLSELKSELRRHRCVGGGLGYFAGKRARLEPTALAAIALGPAASAVTDDIRRWPTCDGLLLERRDGGANYGFHGLALVALRACGRQHVDGAAALVGAIQGVKGVRFDVSPANSRQDYSLQAWSWFPGTFSWVEPTAWCMLALKKWREAEGVHVDSDRLTEAERLLANRSCRDGGWNYGNAEVLGRDLHPYIPTTAAALLALQDRHELEVVRRGLDYLERQATSERSAAALALAAITLAAYGRNPEPVRRELQLHLPTTLKVGNLASIALAACALDPEGHVPFTL